MAGTQSMKLELSADARRAIRDLTKAVEENNKIRMAEARDRRAMQGGAVTTTLDGDIVSADGELTYDENTLYKVHEALERGVSIAIENRVMAPSQVATNLITEMQNDGIKFREAAR